MYLSDRTNFADVAFSRQFWIYLILRNLRAHLNNARVVTADGMSIAWYSRIFGVPMPERCNMTEAFRAFLESNKFRGTRGILIGSTEAEATKAARAIEASSKHCTIVRVFRIHGRQEIQTTV